MFDNTFGKYKINDHYRLDLINRLVNLQNSLGVLNNQLNTLTGYLNTHGVWYGGVSIPYGTVYNIVTVMNFRGDLINGEKNVGTSRSTPVGGGFGNVGVYYGGATTSASTNIVTRLNAYGYILGTETNSGDNYESQLSSAVINNTMFVYGGFSSGTLYAQNNSGFFTTNSNLQTFNSNGTQLTNTVTNAQPRVSAGGVGLNAMVIFYGGVTNQDANGQHFSNNLTKFAPNATQIGSDTQIGPMGYERAGVNIDGLGVYFGGSYLNNFNNEVVRFDQLGNQLGSTVNVGTPRDSAAGASFGNLGVYYAGNPDSQNTSNTVTRLNSFGSMVGLEFNQGTARDNLGVASINL